MAGGDPGDGAGVDPFGVASRRSAGRMRSAGPDRRDVHRQPPHRPTTARTDSGSRWHGTRLAVTLGSIDGPAEIEQLAMKFQAVIADRDTYEVQLSHQALHDPLTGLANRALLVEQLNDALERARRQRALVAVLFIDLDRFKMINDSLGHDLGDTILITAARRISDLVPAGGTLARFGGDEFVVVVEVEDDSLLQHLVDQLLAGIVAPIETDAAVVRVTASIGVATSTPGRRAVDLIRDADNAMYTAKEAGAIEPNASPATCTTELPHGSLWPRSSESPSTEVNCTSCINRRSN